MKVQIKRIDAELPLPEYQTPGSFGFDLHCRENVTIPAQSLALTPLNVIVQPPEGHVLILTARSSTARKKGLMLSNGIGIIDRDFCGPEDEIHASFFNFTKQDVLVERGERLVQGLILPVSIASFSEVEQIEQTSRGGFGSTG